MPSPVAHALAGAGVFMALRQRPPRRSDWPALAFVTVAGMIPDFDVLAGLAGGETFRFHRGISHSIAVVAAGAAVLALAVRRMPHRLRPPGSWAGLWASAVGYGCLHLGMDHFTYTREGFPAFWPFSSTCLAPPPVAAFFPLLVQRLADLARPINLAVMGYELLVTGVPVLLVGLVVWRRGRAELRSCRRGSPTR